MLKKARGRGGRRDGGVEAYRAAVSCTGPATAVHKASRKDTSNREESAEMTAAASVTRPGGLSEVEEAEEDPGDREEVSESEEEAAPPSRRTDEEESRRSADGATPVQPGKSPHLGLAGRSSVVQNTNRPESNIRGAASQAGGSGLLVFLEGIKDLVKKFEVGERMAGGPAAAWVPPAGGSINAAGVGTPAATVAVTAPESAGSEAAQGKEKATETTDRQDITRLADAARCEVYVCYEGPLGAHLKQEVRDKLWKGEYVEIFSLLPLGKI